MRHVPGLTDAEGAQLDTAHEAWRSWRLFGAPQYAAAPVARGGAAPRARCGLGAAAPVR